MEEKFLLFEYSDTARIVTLHSYYVRKTDDSYLNIALDAVLLADSIALKVYRSGDKGVRKKGPDDDLVTRADLEIHEKVTRLLLDRDDGVPVLSKEGDYFPDEIPADCWILDPIDGTYGFSHGYGGFGPMIARVRDGLLYLGVISDSLEGRVVSAVRGQGAFRVEYSRQGNIAYQVRVETADVLKLVGTSHSRYDSIRKWAAGLGFDANSGLVNTAGLGIKAIELVMGRSHLYVSPWDRIFAWDLLASLFDSRGSGWFCHEEGWV